MIANSFARAKLAIRLASSEFPPATCDDPQPKKYRAARRLTIQFATHDIHLRGASGKPTAFCMAYPLHYSDQVDLP
jgi:hypothetical protein